MLGKKSTETRISTLLGQGAEINGEFHAEGSVRLDGKIHGNVSVTGNLILGATGLIEGNINAASALIGGEVLGNIDATDRTELTSTARVFGDIHTNVVVIDEFAVFQGGCNMNQDVNDRKARGAVRSAARADKKAAQAAMNDALKDVEGESQQEG
ncbi:MAG: polymer-forming cytoskeletal protein [Candidatus Gastranaerophilales bacterium]|nr:polymer-forming cytoskeletal protein [Candidatus Gastranaerophilales bacterium]